MQQHLLIDGAAVMDRGGSGNKQHAAAMNEQYLDLHLRGAERRHDVRSSAEKPPGLKIVQAAAERALQTQPPRANDKDRYLGPTEE